MNFQKSIELLLDDCEEGERTERTSRIEESGRECVPMLLAVSALPLPLPSPGADSRDTNGVGSGPANRIVGMSGTGNVDSAVSPDGDESDVDTRCDLPTVGLTTESPKTSNVSVCVESWSVHVGILFPSGDATVAAKCGGGDGLLVGAFPFPSNMEKVSSDSSSGRLHFRVPPGKGTHRSIEADDLELAPGF